MCNKIGHFAKVCKSRKPAEPTPSRKEADPSAQAVSVPTPVPSTVRASTARPQHIDSAPKIAVRVSNPNGSATVKALPDSGADISVAGTDIVQLLGDHTDNLLPSRVTPRTVSGQKMAPIGTLPVTITPGGTTQDDIIYIHPNVKGHLLS